MHWRRMLIVGLLIALAFASGLAVGSHGATGTVQAQTTGAQPASPIQEYPLPNGVLCYTLTTGSGGFSCVYGAGLSPVAPTAPRP